MGKLLRRLIFLAAVVAAALLYVENLSLRSDNVRLRGEVASFSALRSQNAALRAKLTVQHTAIASEPSVWLSAARDHVQKAEVMAAKGDFAGALKQSRFANLALSRAADDASGQTRADIQSLRTRLDRVQSQATTLWRKLGG